MRRLAHLLLASLAWVPSNACSPGGRPDTPRAASAAGDSGARGFTPDSSPLLLRLAFRPAPGESASIVHGLAVVTRFPHPPDLRRPAFPAQVHRLGPGPDALYLVLAHQPRFTNPEGDHWGKSFYVLDLSVTPPALSAPLDMKDADYVALDNVSDLNANGLPDFVYCKGYEGEEDPPMRLGAEYREGRWHHLPARLGPVVCAVPRH